MDESEQALRWIIEILQMHDIPYQVCGGLAARIYGSTRVLNDIDLYMPLARFDEIRPDVEAAITWGPAHETSAHWDLTYVKMGYAGQKIEIGDSEATSIFDSAAQRWIKQDICFDQSVYSVVYDVRIPVMPKAQLLAYKAILARDVDLTDISQIKQAE
jgi:hypothetical protein